VLSPDESAQIQAMARDVIDTNRYMTVGTTEPDGLPRLSPVYYTHDKHRDFYWVSAAGAQHSKNLLRQPTIAVLIFDSSVDPSSTRAVYINATALQIPEPELKDACAIAFRTLGIGARAFEPSELMGTARLRLYRATATEYAVHIRGSDPKYGNGVDMRLPTTLPADSHV
jgi:hypothetical protein